MSRPTEYTPGFRHPAARLIHPAQPSRKALAGLTPLQRADAWRAHRATWKKGREEGLGGSAASTLLGFNEHESLLSLYVEKTTGAPDRDSDQARLGRELEPLILARFREATGRRTRRVGLLARKDCDWMMATPDALTDDSAGVEAKSTTERDHGHEWDESPSDHSYAQAQWYMWVTGLEHWYIAVLFRDTGRFEYYHVERDPHMIDVLTERAAVFWHSYVLTRTAPPLSGTPADLQAAKDLAAAEDNDLTPTGEVDGGEAAAVATRRLHRINERLRELKDLKAAAEVEFVRLIGKHETLLAHGHKVGTYRRNGTMAHAQYAKKYPDRAAQFMKPVLTLDKKQALAEDPVARQFVSRKLHLRAAEDRAAFVPPISGSERAALDALFEAA